MKNALFFICLLGAAPLFSQNNYNKQFRTAFTNWDTSAIVPLLKKWELEAPNDPNLFIARANYYLQASKKEIIRMDAAPGKGENFEILDSTGGKPVAYMYSDVLYTDSLFELSQQALDEGIRQYPNRLDMRFGKIYTLGERGLYKRQTNAIIDACRYGKTIDYA